MNGLCGGVGGVGGVGAVLRVPVVAGLGVLVVLEEGLLGGVGSCDGSGSVRACPCLLVIMYFAAPVLVLRVQEFVRQIM
jgi:hypothetical protein